MQYAVGQKLVNTLDGRVTCVKEIRRAVVRGGEVLVYILEGEEVAWFSETIWNTWQPYSDISINSDMRAPFKVGQKLIDTKAKWVRTIVKVEENNHHHSLGYNMHVYTLDNGDVWHDDTNFRSIWTPYYKEVYVESDIVHDWISEEIREMPDDWIRAAYGLLRSATDGKTTLDALIEKNNSQQKEIDRLIDLLRSRSDIIQQLLNGKAQDAKIREEQAKVTKTPDESGFIKWAKQIEKDYIKVAETPDESKAVKQVRQIEKNIINARFASIHESETKIEDQVKHWLFRLDPAAQLDNTILNLILEQLKNIENNSNQEI